MSAGRLLLRGGQVVDGSGARPVRADVLIEDGLIRAVGVLPAGLDAAMLDVTGALVTPGFVDVHAHDDLALLKPGFADPKLLQGVTLDVVGNCGHGCAPVGADPGLLGTYSGPVLGAFPDPLPWRTFPDYLDHLARSALPTNAVALVPHGALRASVAGYARRPLRPDELRGALDALREGLDHGAAGLSLGLMYAPGDAAPRAELYALARVLARHGKLLAVHLRNEGDGILRSADEALDVARRTGVAVHLSHLKVVSPRNHGRMPELLDRLDAARADGVDVTADVYPYAAGSTTVAAMFPAWALAEGTPGLLTVLADRHDRARVVDDLRREWETLENNVLALGGDRIVLAGFTRADNLGHEGRSLAGIATERGTDPVTCLCDLVVEERGALTVVLFQMDERDVADALAWPWSMVGSDGLPIEARYTHPRMYGTFPRVLARYAVRHGLFTVPEAVRRMTSLPADRFGVPGRGRLVPGAVADLTVLDLDSLADRATFTDPRQLPSGVRAVLLGGTPVAEDGRRTADAGRLVRIGGASAHRTSPALP
ncbi:MAG: D-aminoacylase [Actinocatenispora sp.]